MRFFVSGLPRNRQSSGALRATRLVTPIAAIQLIDLTILLNYYNSIFIDYIKQTDKLIITYCCAYYQLPVYSRDAKHGRSLKGQKQ